MTSIKKVLARDVDATAAGFALWAVLLIAWLVYTPGLKGTFLFDDWANLPPLGAHGPIDNWNAFVTYMLSGIASATGRPISMLSFLLDANNWPAAPEPFKYTNILIHLLNGALLAWLTLRLAISMHLDRTRAAWVAVLTASLWLLHPLMVSATLFVVQRMAMLAATFVLAGLICYVHGRRRLMQRRYATAYVWMTSGICLFGLLATLSKENGALLPLLALLIEILILQHPTSDLRVTERRRAWRTWKTLFLYLPLGLLAAYLSTQIPSMLQSYAQVRDFTLGERLLTEARVVCHYLYLLLVPHIYTGGLFNDDITISTSLFHPWTTLPSIALITGLLATAWRTRKRYPALTLAVFFYFGGQLLESTFVPLELYYEHRNYLPATLFFFPLALWLVTSEKLTRRGRIAIAAVLLVLLASFTWMRATLWGDPFQQAVVWARESPNSPRAQTQLALHWLHRGNFTLAAQILERTLRTHPNDIMVQLNLISAECGLGGVSADRISAAGHALQFSKVGGRVAYNAISKFMRHYNTAPCRGLGLNRLDDLIQAALNNRHVRDNPAWTQDMLTLRGELRLTDHKPRQALNLFRQALNAKPRPAVALYGAALLANSGHPSDGLALLGYFSSLRPSPAHGFGVGRLRALWLQHIEYYPKEISRLKILLQQEAAASPPKRSETTGVSPPN